MKTIVCATMSLVLGSLSQAQTLNILPGTNNVPISSVFYTIDGITVHQTAEATGVAVNRNSPVFLKAVVVNDGGISKTLDSFNSLGAVVTNLNLTSSAKGVGVFKNGSITTTSDIGAFATSLAGITQDTDLLNYNFYDGVSGLPGSTTADYDLLFAKGLGSDDFVLVSERDGNTFFTVVPLGADGSVIAGANSLRFGGPTTLGTHLAYDWNSGYASSTYLSNQSFGFSVAKVDKFFEGTAIAPQTVFGFRIDNNGEADVKFFGLSDNSFSNNPNNPNPLIPEPSSLLLSAFSSLLLFRRQRRDVR
jgi:hypothetical protein